MTLGEIITAFRNKTDDLEEEYKWSDEEITYYSNQVLYQICEEARLIKDSTTSAICQIAVTAGTALYSLDPRVIHVISPVRYGDNRTQISPINSSELFTYRTSWETDDSEEPRAYVSDYETQKIRLYPIPTADTTLHLSVYRLPLTDLVHTTLSGVPEIKTKYHYHLLDGILFHAYQKDDDNTRDDENVVLYSQRWAQNIEMIKRQENRFLDANRPMPYPIGF